MPDTRFWPSPFQVGFSWVRRERPAAENIWRLTIKTSLAALMYNSHRRRIISVKRHGTAHLAEIGLPLSAYQLVRHNLMQRGYSTSPAYLLPGDLRFLWEMKVARAWSCPAIHNSRVHIGRRLDPLLASADLSTTNNHSVIANSIASIRFRLFDFRFSVPLQSVYKQLCDFAWIER